MFHSWSQHTLGRFDSQIEVVFFFLFKDKRQTQSLPRHWRVKRRAAPSGTMLMSGISIVLMLKSFTGWFLLPLAS